MTSRGLAFTADIGADRSNTDGFTLTGQSKQRENGARKESRSTKDVGSCRHWEEAKRQQGVDAERENRSNASHSLQEKKREEVEGQKVEW